MSFLARASLAFVVPVVLLACSGESSPVTPTKDAATDTPTDGGGGYPEPIADPPPADLPVLLAHDASGDSAPDFSCAGTPLPVEKTPTTERDLTLSELGDETQHVADLPIEIFFDDKLGATADAKGTAKKGTGATDPMQGKFTVSVPTGFVTTRVVATGSFVSTVQLDVDLRAAPFIIAVTPQAQVDAMETLIGGTGFKSDAGATRMVVNLIDCKKRSIVGAHVAIDIDGTVVPIVTKGTGVYRAYFNDARFPSKATSTSRSGVVAFLDVPAKGVRVVARGRLAAGGPITVVAGRPMITLADGVVTAFLSPWTAP